MPKSVVDSDTQVWANWKIAATKTGLSRSTLKIWRLGREGQPPRLVEGLHWVRFEGESEASKNALILYNIPLLLDFIANGGNTAPHQKACDAYLASLPSSRAAS